jgi:protein TonB
MKKILFTLIASIFTLSAIAQKNDTIKVMEADTSIYTSAENLAEFPGGINEFYRYLSRSIRYPKDAREHRITGRVVVAMVIEKSGNLSNIKVLHSVYPDLDNEAIRVVRGSPKWIPAIRDGKSVRSSFTLPISFRLR